METVITYAEHGDGRIVPIYRVYDGEELALEVVVPDGFVEDAAITKEAFDAQVESAAAAKQAAEDAAQAAAAVDAAAVAAEVAARKAALMVKLDLTQAEVDLLVDGS